MISQKQNLVSPKRLGDRVVELTTVKDYHRQTSDNLQHTSVRNKIWTIFPCLKFRKKHSKVYTLNNISIRIHRKKKMTWKRLPKWPSTTTFPSFLILFFLKINTSTLKIPLFNQFTPIFQTQLYRSPTTENPASKKLSSPFNTDFFYHHHDASASVISVSITTPLIHYKSFFHQRVTKTLE